MKNVVTLSGQFFAFALFACRISLSCPPSDTGLCCSGGLGAYGPLQYRRKGSRVIFIETILLDPAALCYAPDCEIMLPGFQVALPSLRLTSRHGTWRSTWHGMIHLHPSPVKGGLFSGLEISGTGGLLY